MTPCSMYISLSFYLSFKEINKGHWLINNGGCNLIFESTPVLLSMNIVTYDWLAAANFMI